MRPPSSHTFQSNFQAAIRNQEPNLRAPDSGIVIHNFQRVAKWVPGVTACMSWAMTVIKGDCWLLLATWTSDNVSENVSISVSKRVQFCRGREDFVGGKEGFYVVGGRVLKEGGWVFR